MKEGHGGGLSTRAWRESGMYCSCIFTSKTSEKSERRYLRI